MADFPGEAPYLYGGFSGVTMEQDSLDLGHGLRLRKKYAHLTSPCIMAFARAEPGRPHPAPWRAAKGGYAFDIEIEIGVPNSKELPGGLSGKDTVWWIAALLRLAAHPYLSVPALSDAPFDAEGVGEPTIIPFETEHRLFQPPDPTVRNIDTETLAWLASTWASSAQALASNSKFRLALAAVDACAVQGEIGPSLLAVWGALEQLFMPGRNELRFRVSAHIAAFLEPPGEKRHKLFKQVLSLYDSRSAAAHSASKMAPEPLVGSYVIARNAVMKIIEQGKIPTQDDFERLLFCVDESPEQLPANSNSNSNSNPARPARRRQ